ncbi:DegT/DnrJ/EryC1/StrS family aminotransferase [Polaribacter cellanae]|uniref:Aminotransferase class I/II-fold pyridoxal phosphate-dependent enzyme n=1 Tax=Polaribacter cellanae TaxID=2818493 RepID=A0A975CSL0_9FLAO|nr:aminotransferase class I/II-fold pyridoxal phosphate-dependent enzyme [Polaribacter cellanae]QTE22526.1 aminotransferase class I/II-fold pyridoxal phosphate-dependent enzyme [Polaribacter cellanae]
MDNRIFLSKSNVPLKNLNLLEDNNILEFEKLLEKYFGEEKSVLAVNSGTSAIHLSLLLAGVSKGDDVVCQSFTFSASANPIIYQGANPIFIDSEIDTWNMCPFYLEKAIKHRIKNGKKPKAIIFVHLYGMPAKIEEISLIAKKYNIILIEDAAEALGSTYKGQKCGTFGDFGIISFNNNKLLTTFGGGALICKDVKQKEKAFFFSTQARDQAPHYQHSQIGYNYRMSSVLAGIGRGQMSFLNEYLSFRRSVNQFYKSIFKDIDGIYVFEESNKILFSNHWLSCIIVNEKEAGFASEDIRLQLLEDNIESRLLWKPMHLQPIFKEALYFGGSISENLFKQGLCLPSGSNLTKNQLKRISISIKKLL